jgi:dolichol-phosphate mannosyltransferase
MPITQPPLDEPFQERRRGVEVSVVVPTFNESKNIEPMVQALGRVLATKRWEVIFVDDDSPDGTAAEVRRIAQLYNNVRCVHRIGRRGLSRAVVEGIQASCAPIAVVMDGDMQHDENVVTKMISAIQSGECELAVGSRYVDGGGIGEWDKGRARMSRFATDLAKLVLRQPVSDPMSGFFAISRPAFETRVRHLSGEGFKILLDLLASGKEPLRLKEIAYTFKERVAGESKLDMMVLFEYLTLILEKKSGGIIPPKLVMFGLVGLSGMVVHFTVLALLFKFFGTSFIYAQSIATATAMTGNFFINNIFTYRDRRLKGWKMLGGLLSFLAVCSFGAAANVGIANVVFDREYTWWFAAVAGIAVGTIWNYAITSALTWGRK